MRVEDLHIGSVYYRYYIANGSTPIVESWLYLGFNRHTSNTAQNDLPFYFYQFELVAANVDSSSIVNFPSKVETEESMMEWSDFLKALKETPND